MMYVIPCQKNCIENMARYAPFVEEVTIFFNIKPDSQEIFE